MAYPLKALGVPLGVRVPLVEDHCHITRYPCDICGKVYRQAGTRNRHKKNHFNHSYKCWICPSEFRRKDTLNHHVRGVHGVAGFSS